jgi:hypothetical protein
MVLIYHRALLAFELYRFLSACQPTVASGTASVEAK